MPPYVADREGYQDGLRKVPMAPSRCGYPDVYEAAYRRGLLERSHARYAAWRLGQFLQSLAVRS